MDVLEPELEYGSPSPEELSSPRGRFLNSDVAQVEMIDDVITTVLAIAVNLRLDKRPGNLSIACASISSNYLWIGLPPCELSFGQPPPISPLVSTTRNSPFMWMWRSHQKGTCIVSLSAVDGLEKCKVMVFPGSR